MTDERAPRPPTAEEAALAARLERLDRLARRRDALATSDRPAATGGPSAAKAAPATGRRTRRHPAQAARYAAVGLSIVSTAGLTSLFMGGSSGAAQQLAGATVVTTSPTGASTNGTGGTASAVTSSPSTTAAPTRVSTGPAVVDGAAFQNRWGTVQVEVTFASDGSIQDVTPLQTPNDRGRSIEINDYAVPRLDAEAVSIQGAQVHTISGATYTSTDYRRSLQSAIDAARAAQITQLA